MVEKTQHYNIVSGLRRSGTSLMMLALRTAGIPILGQKYAVHTNFNAPISDNEKYGNPNGYWEMGGITCLTGLRNNHLELGMNNDVIKVVADCFYYSDPNSINKIIMMKRNPRYTLASLVKSETFKLNQLEAYIQKATVDIKRTLDFIEYGQKHHQFELLVVEYDKLLEDPEKHVKKAIDFLNLGIGDYKRGASIVDKKLKRTEPFKKDYEGLKELEEIIENI